MRAHLLSFCCGEIPFGADQYQRAAFGFIDVTEWQTVLREPAEEALLRKFLGQQVAERGMEQSVSASDEDTIAVRPDCG